MRNFVVVILVLTLAIVLPATVIADTLDQWVVTPGQIGGGESINVTATMNATWDPSGCGSYTICSSCCKRAWLRVSPCPLSKTCSDDTYSQVYFPSGVITDTLSLQCGTQYTFSGDWSAGWALVIPDGSCSLWCFTQGNFSPTTFLYGATPARQATWGQIKSLYR